ncbi:MAG: hypothetical protein IPJ30_07860 [Acidobacteria bacterium]|nr:hypothetical protein [Acidobacteriota bacterium]
MRVLRIPMPFQILLMLSVLTFGGAYLLLGQQAPSEESDWPWKVVTESKVFLNGAPVGKLSNLLPLTKKIGAVVGQGRRIGKFDQYEYPQVLIVADPDTSIARIAQLADSIVEATGEPILVKRSSLDNPSTGPKPNPLALVVTTENIDANKAKRLGNLPDSELGSVGHRVNIFRKNSPEELRLARTYESSIEIGSDGKYFLNEPTAKLEVRSSTNVGSRLLTNTVQMPPVAPLKQRILPRAELPSAIAKLVSTANSESQEIFIIASEKARYDSLLQILEGIDTEARIVVMVRLIEAK